MEHVVVERIFENPVHLEDIQDIEAKFKRCVDLYDSKYLCGYLSSNGRRMICIFEAPSAETVASINRHSGIAFERVWTATIHESRELEESGNR